MLRFVLLIVLVQISLLLNLATADTLRFGRTAMPPGLGNPYTSISQPASGAWTPIFDTLVAMNTSGELEPALAISWVQSEPNLWIFTLRQDVVFQNGRKFDAEIVERVFRILLGEEGPLYYVYNEIKGIESVSRVDDRTVEFRTRNPDPILPQRLSLIMIVEPFVFERGADAFAIAPIGTGPYKLATWGQSRGTAVYEAFDLSWRSPKDISRIEIKEVADSTALIQALVSSSVDLIELQSYEPDLFIDSENFIERVIPLPVIMLIHYVLVDRDGTTWSNPQLRAASNYAINRDIIVEEIFDGRVQAVYQPAIPGMTGFNPNIKAVPYDPAHARSIIQAEGYGEGLLLRIGVPDTYKNAVGLSVQIMAQYLREIGIDVELVRMPFAQYSQRYMQGDWSGLDAFASFMNLGTYFDASAAFRVMSCKKVNPFYCNDDIAEIVDDAEYELDPRRREELLKKTMSMMHDDHAAIWLTTLPWEYIHSRKVENFQAGIYGVKFEELELLTNN